MNNDELKSNLLSAKHWLRLIFMLLFAALLQVASIIMWVLVLLQFIFSLITGQDNINLRKFGYSLSTYIYQTLKFLTYSSEEKPFPFADWPEGEEDAPVEIVEVVVTPAARVSKPTTATQKGDTDSQSDL